MNNFEGLQFLRLKRELKPKPIQIKEFNKYFGYRRYIYNLSKEIHMKYMGEKYGFSFKSVDGNKITFRNLRNCIKNLKKEEWENDYSTQISDTAIEDYFEGYRRSIELGTGIPKFKSRIKSTESFRFNMKQWNTTEGRRTFMVKDNKYLKLPRITEKCGWIKLKEPLFHGKYEDFPKLNGFQMVSVTIKREADRYYAIFVVKFNEGELYKDLPEKQLAISLDVNDLAILYYNKNKKDKIKILTSEQIKEKYDFYERKINHYQKLLKFKEYNSKSWNKIRLKLQKVYLKLRNLTIDHHHKLSTDLINKYMYISLYSFDVFDTISEFHSPKVRRKILQNNSNRFYLDIKYKSELYGNFLIENDEFFNPMKICHNCGHHNEISFREKTFKCRKCKMKIDRKLNTVINLRNYLLNNI